MESNTGLTREVCLSQSIKDRKLIYFPTDSNSIIINGKEYGADLSNYVLRDDLTDYVLQDDLSNYVLKDDDIITSVRMNNTTYGPGNIDLGTVVTDVSNKVDKEAGKGLSTNDFTTAEKTKLAGLSNSTFRALPNSMNEFKNKSVEEFCRKLKELVNPQAGDAFLTGGASFTEMPPKFGYTGLCELMIYVPSNGLYYLELITTNNFSSDTDDGDPGRWYAVFDVGYNGGEGKILNKGGTGHESDCWRGFMTCPLTKLSYGNYKYIPILDSDGASKYYVDLKTSASSILTSISGYDATKTLILKHVSGSFFWQDA